MRKLNPLLFTVGIALPLLMLLSTLTTQASIMGEENFALLKLVAGQMTEIERLTENLEISRQNIKLLVELNEGVDKVIDQISRVDALYRRSIEISPTSISDLASLNSQISELKYMSAETKDLLIVKMMLVDQSIEQASVISKDDFYSGNQMIAMGEELSKESATASPGRAAQISASAQSAALVNSGLQLQALSHLIQLEGQSLELQKQLAQNQMSQSLEQEKYFRSELSPKPRQSTQFNTKRTKPDARN